MNLKSYLVSTTFIFIKRQKSTNAIGMKICSTNTKGTLPSQPTKNKVCA